MNISPRDQNSCEIYGRLNDALEKGRQGVWVCRLITNHETEKLEVKRSVQIEKGLWAVYLRISAKLQSPLNRRCSKRNSAPLFVQGSHRYVAELNSPIEQDFPMLIGSPSVQTALHR